MANFIDGMKISQLAIANERYTRATENFATRIRIDCNPEMLTSDTIYYRMDISACIKAYRALLEATLDFPVIGVPTKYW